MNISLKGRNAIITGANQGLGLAVARSYLEAGASVLLCARDSQKLEAARAALGEVAGPEQVLATQTADVSRQADVDALADAAFKLFPQVHILVNNAGIYGPMGCIEDVNWQEWVQTVETNLLGSVRMCRAVVPHLKAHGYGKVVQLSGGGATNPMPRISAYAASKAAIVRFAESLAGEVREFGIDVNCVAPGALNTRMLDELLSAGPQAVGEARYRSALKQKEEGGSSIERAARLITFLGAAESDGITGKLISAVWDPWETLPEHRAELAKSDVYTLRRIIPKERGMDWGD